MKRIFFHKTERLCSKKTIGALFASGETFLGYPLKVVFVKTQADQVSPVLAAFSVSKRNFKQAVKRNFLKRRMREAYRLNKNQFYSLLNEKESRLAVMFIFVGKEICEYELIKKGMTAALKKIVSKIDRNPSRETCDSGYL